MHRPLKVKMLCRFMYLATIPNVLQFCPSHRPWFGKINKILLTSQIIKVFLMQYNVTYCQISSYDQIMSSELSPDTPNLCNLVCGAEQDYFRPKMTWKKEWISSMTGGHLPTIIPQMFCI
jgi:hypothetical protein